MTISAIFPFLCGTGPVARDALYEALKRENVFARRYFYPLISDMQPYRDPQGGGAPLPVARRIADEVLCLPISASMTREDAERVARAVREAMAGRS